MVKNYSDENEYLKEQLDSNKIPQNPEEKEYNESFEENDTVKKMSLDNSDYNQKVNKQEKKKA